VKNGWAVLALAVVGGLIAGGFLALAIRGG